MDIHDTLQEGIGLLEAARPRAFGAGVVVDRDRLLQLLRHAEQSLPEEIMAAASILAQRAQIVAAAQSEAELVREQGLADAEQVRSAAHAEAEAVRGAAERDAADLVQRAEHERAELLDEHETLLEAQARAREIIARAEHQSAAMRNEVDAYVDAKLAAIAATLGRTLDTIEAGRRKVRATAETVVDEHISLR